MNEWGLNHLCVHIDQTGPEEPPEDGEMDEMTLPSKRQILTSKVDRLTIKVKSLAYLSKVLNDGFL